MSVQNLSVIYENGHYSVVINPYDHCYYIVNKVTGNREAREEAAPTALFRADALEQVALKHREVLVEKDANV